MSSLSEFETVELCDPETARVLRDAELAVDESVLSHPTSRRPSTIPRISDRENPFVDLGPRLSSRRVRPIVVELIQALGHYVDAVWSMRYPDTPCPWVIAGRQVVEGDRPPSSQFRAATPSLSPKGDTWKSHMLTAVEESRRAGHVSTPTTQGDVDFWRSEVWHTLRDVDEVVGIYKGTAWAFGKALEEGDYEQVDDDNVLGPNGRGGNFARLLNDLEEALWWVIGSMTRGRAYIQGRSATTVCRPGL